MAESIHISQEDNIFGEDWLDSYAATSILEAKYEAKHCPERHN